MKNSLIEKLISQYRESVNGIVAVLVYERKELLIIKKSGIINLEDLQIHIDNISNIIQEDKDFLIIREISGKKYVFCSLGSNFILVTIAEKEISDLELKLYSVHIASEIELKETSDSEYLSLKIPGVIKLYSKLQSLNLLTEKLSLKIIILGDYKTGKTSLVKRFIERLFKKERKSTVGFNVYKKILNVDDKVIMNLAIWDTGGFSSQISPTKEKIYKFADAAIIVLDTSNQNNLASIKKWYNEIKNCMQNEIPIALAISKNDIDLEESMTNLKDIENFATNNMLDIFMVSAKTGENIDDLFFELIFKVINLKSNDIPHELGDEINKYKDNYLDPVELNALRDLEHIIIENLKAQSKFLQTKSKKVEEDGIPIIFEVSTASFGVKIEEGNVVGLGLFNCYLNSLPDSISSFKHIKKLNLRCNHLIKLPDAITKLDSLEELDLVLTDLSILPEGIKKLKKLKILHLENNSLEKLPNSIGNLEFLEELNLSNNPIKFLPKEISNLRSLRKLWLEAPSIFYKGALKQLPENFGNLIFLQELDLSSCEIEYLPSTFGNLKSLKILDLYNNKLSSLPDTIGELKMLEILNLENNKLKLLPDSIGALLNLKQIKISKNPLRKKASEKFKALALKSKGMKYKRLMQLSELCKQEEGAERIDGKSKRRPGNILKPLLYASTVALLGLITFLTFRINSQTLDITVWTMFTLALFINFIIGTCIIASISSYFKISSLFFTHKIIKIFDIFVIIYLIWAIRALIKIFLAIELIPSINFLFEVSFPPWFKEFLVNFGYNLHLTFLENLDLFFGHFYLKIFSIALVFWALYRNGIAHVRKTIFDGKANKNLWIFLLIGLFGALALAIMNYSNLKPLLDIGYNFGVIIGSSLFIWEINKIKKSYFYYYLLLILGGILTVWMVSYFDVLFSLVIFIVLIISYFMLRTLQHKKMKYYIH